ncbi:MAG: hypothetical protein E7329_05485 [Clostridiales bacterium]|nr:hypothetical protein [Clostridiales bacterium]
MKKILALALALMMALSCTGALAEDAPAPFTAYGSIAVNEELLSSLLNMTGTEMDEQTQQVMKYLVDMINNLGFYVMYADNSAQVALTLKDIPVVTVAGTMDENGVTAVSDLFPNSVITISPETIKELELAQAAMPQVDAAQLETAIMPHLEKLSNGLAAYAGTPIPGEYTIAEGLTFNCQIPYNISTKEFIALGLGTLKAIMEDPTLAPLFSVSVSGDALSAADLDELLASLADADVEEMPAMNMAMYTNMTASGSVGEDYYLAFDLGDEEYRIATLGGWVEGTFTMSFIFGEATFSTMDEMVNAALEGIGEAAVIDLYLFPGETEEDAAIALDVYTMGQYVGLYAETLTEEDALSTYLEVFFMDPENPLLALETVTMFTGEKLELNIGEEAAVISLEALMNDEEGTVSGQLMMDMMAFGLNNVIANATAAMPEEVTALITLMNTPVETEETITETVTDVQ